MPKRKDAGGYRPLAVPPGLPGATVQVYYDTDARAPNAIAMYYTCTRCERERPPDETPASWARLNVGVTTAGLVQVVCARHACSVALLHLVASHKGGH